MASTTKSADAINLLKLDHKTVEKLFQQFQGCTDETKQHEICQEICTELAVHTEVEEQCFYPGVRSVAGLEDMVDESLEEHSQVKHLCSQLKGMSAGDTQMKPRIMDLKQAVEHHVKEEEHEMFPQVRESCDQQWLLGIGQAMEQQKMQIKDRMAEDWAPGQQRIREDVREPSHTETWR